MVSYVLDLAFNVDASQEYQEPDFALQGGLASVTEPSTGEGSPQWLTQLRSQDQLSFRIWDFSEFTVGSTLLNVWIAFFDPASWLLVDPVLGQANPLVNAEPFGVDTATVKSSVFTPVRAGWILGVNHPPLGQTFVVRDVTAPKRYVLQVRVQVKTPSAQLRTFVYDPEVVISPDGP